MEGVGFHPEWCSFVTWAKLVAAPHLVMAGQQPVEDGRKRPYVPAIPIIGHCAILIEIAGLVLDKPGDDATIGPAKKMHAAAMIPTRNRE